MTTGKNNLCRNKKFSGSLLRNGTFFLFAFLILASISASLVFCCESASSPCACGENTGLFSPDSSMSTSIQKAGGPDTALPVLRTNPFSVLQQTVRTARIPLLSTLRKLQVLLMFALAAITLLFDQHRTPQSSSFRNYIFQIVLKASRPVRAGPTGIQPNN